MEELRIQAEKNIIAVSITTSKVDDAFSRDAKPAHCPGAIGERQEMIRFTDHARRKFRVLEELGFKVDEDRIDEILRNPRFIQRTWKDRFAAAGRLNSSHMVRIVFEKENGNIVVVTFYPVRRKRYEGKL